MNDSSRAALVSCPLCDSRDLASSATTTTTTCRGCGSVLTQAGIDALAGVEHPDAPDSPLEALERL